MVKSLHRYIVTSQTVWRRFSLSHRMGEGRGEGFPFVRISVFIILGGMWQESPEFLFVDRLVISLFRRDAFHSHVLENRVVQRLIAELLADLDHAGDLMGLAFAHKIGDGGGKHQNL